MGAIGRPEPSRPRAATPPADPEPAGPRPAAHTLDRLPILPILSAVDPQRTITASNAKANLGEVLGSLAVKGPVNITRNGRLVGVLTAPTMPAAAPQDGRASRSLDALAVLEALAVLYASGAISWRRIADETGVAFGELLSALARQGLALPQVSAAKRPAQAALWETALRQAAGR